MKNEFKIIINLLPVQSRVLDVGCGDGTLIEALIKQKNIDARGIELEENKVKQCISKGLSVIQGNAETELGQFPDKAFDFVILSQTLQAFYQPENVLDQLLRISHRVIVSIPNFGYWKVRLHLLMKGTMPVTRTLPDEWYNTPNLHMCTIKDFFNFCENRNINLYKSIALQNLKSSKITNTNLALKNLTAVLGIFLIEK